jgi:hypothetical protein
MRLLLLLAILIIVAVALSLFGTSTPSVTQTATNTVTVDINRPVYLAKDAVECGTINVMGTYMDGQQAGGEAQGHRAVADLFVHPKDGCVRSIRRERVRVLDAAVSTDKLVTVECVTEFENHCNVRPQDLGN